MMGLLLKRNDNGHGGLAFVLQRAPAMHRNITDSTPNPLTVELELTDRCLHARIDDCRAEVAERLAAFSQHQQEQLARDAWRIGMRTMLTAHAHAEEARLADVARTLQQDLDHQLDRYLEQQETKTRAVLAKFFDPKDGLVTQRMNDFVNDQGVLARLLQQYVGTENSVLAETLARQVGERSPLFKKLNPTESEGVVQMLASKVEEALELNRKSIAHALDPVAEGGAVAQFIGRLREELESADEDREKQLASALAALDQNDEGSLISTLMRESRAAHDALRHAVNPQIPDSPVAVVKRTLEEMLSDRLDRQDVRLEKIQEEQKKLHADIHAAVERIETRKAEQALSARGGDEFEDQVVGFLTQVVPEGLCTVEPTGDRTGARRNCKVGDAVVEFCEETVYAGCRVVVEAKRDRSCTAPKALEELETAKANRQADVGLFVMARSTAPTGFPAFARYGTRILVVWDPDDPVSDGTLHGAVVAALALAKRRSAGADAGDLAALADVEQRLVKELQRLGRIDDCAEKIRDQADKVSDEVRKGRKKLALVVKNAKATLRALNVELREEEVEAANPITVGAVKSRPAESELEEPEEESDAAE